MPHLARPTGWRVSPGKREMNLNETPMEPYNNFLTALLAQSIKDTQSGNPDRARVATQWIRTDPQCTEICDWLEMDHTSLVTALEQRESVA